MKERKARSWVAALGYRPKSLELFSGKFRPADLGKDVIGRANLVAHFDDALVRARVILAEGVAGTVGEA